jgi:hypothetical protein
VTTFAPCPIVRSAVAATLGACGTAGAQWSGTGGGDGPGSTVTALGNLVSSARVYEFGVGAPQPNQVGIAQVNAFAMDYDAAATTLYVITRPGNTLGTLAISGPGAGAFTPIATISGAGAGETNWSGLTLDPTTGVWYASAVTPLFTGTRLYTLNIATGATTLVNWMGAPGMVIIDIAADASGVMYAHDNFYDALYTVNKATGALTLVGFTGFDAAFAHGMDFDFATGNLYGFIVEAGGASRFVRFDTATGAAATLAVTTGWGPTYLEMAVRAPLSAGACYANCDASSTAPVLNVADFTCFLQRFAAGDSYANCDGSTTAPTLNVADFTCFLQRFAAGCP